MVTKLLNNAGSSPGHHVELKIRDAKFYVRMAKTITCNNVLRTAKATGVNGLYSARRPFGVRPPQVLSEHGQFCDEKLGLRRKETVTASWGRKQLKQGKNN